METWSLNKSFVTVACKNFLLTTIECSLWLLEAVLVLSRRTTSPPKRVRWYCSWVLLWRASFVTPFADCFAGPGNKLWFNCNPCELSCLRKKIECLMPEWLMRTGLYWKIAFVWWVSDCEEDLYLPSASFIEYNLGLFPQNSAIGLLPILSLNFNVTRALSLLDVLVEVLWNRTAQRPTFSAETLQRNLVNALHIRSSPCLNRATWSQSFSSWLCSETRTWNSLPSPIYRHPLWLACPKVFPIAEEIQRQDLH